MLYFKDFGSLLYKFGNEEDPIVFENISKYADVIDQVKDDLSFFNYHNIQEGFRPDQVSIQLYDTPLYYWTFYLLNDDIRQQGWPLPNGELLEYVKKNYPNTTITTRENIAAKFKVGQTVTGGTSGATGKIIRRNLNLGQIVIEGTVNFTISGELLVSTNSSGTVETLDIVSSSAEYNAARHYIDASGLIVDMIDPDPGFTSFPFIAPGAQYTEKTNLDVEFDVNQSLRVIRILKPSTIGSLVSGFKRSIRE